MKRIRKSLIRIISIMLIPVFILAVIGFIVSWIFALDDIYIKLFKSWL